MPFEALVKTCTDFYSSEMIQEAKDLLWESVMTVFHGHRRDLRNIKRKNTGASSKARADCEDVVKALQVCDRDGTEMPKFYAVDLNNIPSAPSDSPDIAVLLGQMNRMQGDMQELKNAMKSLQETVPKSVQTCQDQQRNWAAVAASPPRVQPGRTCAQVQQMQLPSHEQ